MSIFEQAAKQKLRFQSGKGLLSVEDLYDLPLTTTSAVGASLDNVARAIAKRIKETETESFVTENPKGNASDDLALEIVKSVIAFKKEEALKRADAQAKREQRDRLMEIISRKKNEQLEGTDLAELEKRLAELS